MATSAGPAKNATAAPAVAAARGELDPQQYALTPEPVREERGEGSCERGRNHAHDSDDSDAGRPANVVREDGERDEEAPFSDDRRPVHDLQPPQRRVPQDRPVRPGHFRRAAESPHARTQHLACPSRGRQPPAPPL